MTAAAILKRYRRIAPFIGHKASAWLVLLAVADAGDEGLSGTVLKEHLHSRCLPGTATLNRWIRQGLLVSGKVPSEGGRGSRDRVIFKATPTLYSALAVDPAPKAIGPRS